MGPSIKVCAADPLDRAGRTLMGADLAEKPILLRNGPESLRFPGPMAIPFEHLDVRVYIDNLSTRSAMSMTRCDSYADPVSRNSDQAASVGLGGLSDQPRHGSPLLMDPARGQRRFAMRPRA